MAALAVSVSAFAQGFNPVVEVTNTYEGKLMEVHKQHLDMNVPDSLLKFDWDFDYSTFDNPYKGAYDFSPYAMNITPEKEGYTGRGLYLRAGAGYSLHPEVQAVWSPMLDGKFQMSVYDSFKGYAGDYHSFNYDKQDLDFLLSRGSAVSGSDFSNRTGINARVDAEKIVMTFDGGWDYIRAVYDGCGNLYNSADGSIGLRTAGHSRLGFELNASLRRGWNAVEDDRYNETIMKLGGSFNYKLDAPGSSAVLAFGTERAGWKEDDGKGHTGYLYLMPQYVRTWDRASVKLGVKASLPYSSDHKGFFLYPQLYADYMLNPQSLKVFASLTGGNHFETFHSLLESNHFIPTYFASNYSKYLGDMVTDAFDAKAGVSGRVRTNFQYTLSAGVERHNNMLAASFFPTFVGSRAVLLFGRADLLVKHVDFEGAWTSDRVDVDASVVLRDTNLKNDFAMILPSALTGSLKVMYNWNGRIYAGVSAQAASARKGACTFSSVATSGTGLVPVSDSGDMMVPGWVDLGLSAEYKLSRKLSFWAKGGNLLGHSIQRNLLYSEKGAYFTAGICLSL